MNPNDELWQRIAAYRFDAEGCEGRFVSKLARDNGWSIGHARRVVEEYRRYAWLACTAGHVVVPSEQVDQAWHQHLLDTQPYWEVFCRQVLRRPLHHRPSRGGIEDRRRHVELYEQSLASYESAFGDSPPSDIWPPASQRFGRDLQQRRVPLHEYWLIPRRRTLATAASLLVLGGAAVIGGAAPLYAGAGNPLDFDGPSFLKLYLLLFPVALVATLFLRHRLLGQSHSRRTAFSDAARDELDPYEAAALHTNGRLAINAAIAAMERDGAISVVEEKTRGWLSSSTRYRLVSAGPPPREPLPLEAAVYDEVARHEKGVKLSDVHDRLEPLAASLIASLQNRGLLLPPGSGPRKFGVVLPLLALAALGAAKVVIGLLRDRPVVILIVLIVATLVTALIVAGTMKRTHRARAALRDAEARHLRRERLAQSDVPNGRELAWLLGLYGVAVLHGGSMATLHAALTADASRGGGAGSASSGGCGGGCGGGGSGCGGGCGGCGG